MVEDNAEIGNQLAYQEALKLTRAVLHPDTGSMTFYFLPISSTDCLDEL